MHCSDFLERFSDYFDRVGESTFLADADAHVNACESCRRYVAVVEQGREAFLSCPSLKTTRDFYPRLRHRLYHALDEDSLYSLSRTSSGSATTALTILGMAMLLTAVAWYPLVVMAEPEVELSPIVVSSPATRPLGLRPPPVSLTMGASRTLATNIGVAPSGSGISGLEQASLDLFERSHILLYEYSPLSDKNRNPRPIRVGFD